VAALSPAVIGSSYSSMRITIYHHHVTRRHYCLSNAVIFHSSPLLFQNTNTPTHIRFQSGGFLSVFPAENIISEFCSISKRLFSVFWSADALNPPKHNDKLCIACLNFQNFALCPTVHWCDWCLCDRGSFIQKYKQLTRCNNNNFINNFNQLNMFRTILSLILRSTRLCLQLVVYSIAGALYYKL